MSDLVTTQIRALTAPGTSQPVRAPNGSHVLTATVTGSGSVAAALTWQGSNDLLGWVTLGTLSASGTGVAGGSASTALDYAYWQVRLDSMTGAQCAVSIATAPAEDASNSSPFTPAEAASIKGVVSGAGMSRPLLKPPVAASNYKISAGSAFVDFTGTWTLSGSNNTSAFDTTAPYYARAAVLCPDNSGAALASVSQTGLSFTLQSTDVFTILLDNAGSIKNNDQLWIRLSSDGLVSKALNLMAVLKVAHGTRLYITLRVSDATVTGGELVTNTFNYIQVRYTRDGGAGTGSVRILGVIKNAKARPKIIIDFDDNRLTAWQYAFPIMAKYGLLGNIAYIESRLGTAGYATATQLQEMFDAGWDFMTHGDTNHSTGPRSTILAEMIANRNAIVTRGWSRNNSQLHNVLPGGIVSPAGTYDTWGVLAEAGMLSARLVDAQVQTTATGVDNAYGLWSRTIASNTGVTQLLSDVDRAIECGGTVRLHGHEVVPTIGDATLDLLITDFETLCSGISDRIRDGKIDNMTHTNWWAHVTTAGLT